MQRIEWQGREKGDQGFKTPQPFGNFNRISLENALKSVAGKRKPETWAKKGKVKLAEVVFEDPDGEKIAYKMYPDWFISCDLVEDAEEDFATPFETVQEAQEYLWSQVTEAIRSYRC